MELLSKRYDQKQFVAKSQSTGPLHGAEVVFDIHPNFLDMFMANGLLDPKTDLYCHNRGSIEFWNHFVTGMAQIAQLPKLEEESKGDTLFDRARQKWEETKKKIAIIALDDDGHFKFPAAEMELEVNVEALKYLEEKQAAKYREQQSAQTQTEEKDPLDKLMSIVREEMKQQRETRKELNEVIQLAQAGAMESQVETKMLITKEMLQDMPRVKMEKEEKVKMLIPDEKKMSIPRISQNYCQDWPEEKVVKEKTRLEDMVLEQRRKLREKVVAKLEETVTPTEARKYTMKDMKEGVKLLEEKFKKGEELDEQEKECIEWLKGLMSYEPIKIMMVCRRLSLDTEEEEDDDDEVPDLKEPMVEFALRPK